MRRLPRYEVREGFLARRGPDKKGLFSFEQKMVDVLLSIDLVRLCSKGKITHAALLAGDGDFVPAVAVAKEETVVLALFHGTTFHRSLWNVADDRYPIDAEFIGNVLLESNAAR